MIPKLKATAARGVRPLVAAVLSWTLLLGAVGLGLRMPGEERIRPLSGPGGLDYSQILGERFGPLSASFIARILGLDVDDNRSRTILASERERSRLPLSGQPRVIVNHPFNNDDFANAYPLPSIPFTARTNTRAAGRESGEPGDCAGVGGSVWYRYRIGGDLGLMATTFGSNYPTAIGVFAGNDLRDLRLVGCNSHPAGNARVPFPAKAGQTYFFQVMGPAGGGDLVFNLDPLGATGRVSVSTQGREANGGSLNSSISADGRYVAFHSESNDLVEGDTNSCPIYQAGLLPSCPDVFVHDRLTRVTERVSVSSTGRQAEGAPSKWPAISGNGRYVAFFSLASNLVPGDTNERWDVFLHDRVTKITSRLSVTSRGEQSTGPLSDAHLQPPSASVSFDGRLIAFTSDFSNLVDGDTNACTAPASADHGGSGHHGPGTHAPVAAIYACRDVFIHDTGAHATTRVSVSSSGNESIGDSAGVFMTPEGRYVVFASDAPGLVDGDANSFRDVFVHDRVTGTTELVSVSPSGLPGDSNSGGFGVRGHNTISSDGRYVGFVSLASNLAPEDGDPDSDVFVHDRLTGKTRMLSGAGRGETGAHSMISADGRFIAFSAQFPIVQGGEDLVHNQVYVYDQWTDTITQVSVSSAGEEADDFAFEPEISADGRYVAFDSPATNLAANDKNGQYDVFVHQLGWAR